MMGSNLMGFGKLTGSQGQTSCDSVFVASVAFCGLTLTPFLPVAPGLCTALRPLTRNPLHSSIGPSDHLQEGRGALSWFPPLGGREGMSHHSRRPRVFYVFCCGGQASFRAPQEPGGAEVVTLKTTDKSTHSRNPQGASTSPQSFP